MFIISIIETEERNLLKTEFKCKVFEDNEGCVELTKCPRMRSRAKHIATKYHHFWNNVEDGIITVDSINIDGQQADILNKN
eukprot:5216227-Ditylum_brightwellii.AAC.1